MMNEFGFKGIINHLLDSIVVIHPGGKILYFNESASRNNMFIPASLIVGHSIIESIPRDRKEHISFLFRKACTLSTTQATEMVYTDPNGYSLHYELTFNPVLNGRGEPTQICLIAHDITIRKSAQRRSTEIFRDLSTLIENANAIIFGVDGSGYITEWNKESSRLTGYSSEEVLTHYFDILIESSEKKNMTDILDLINTGEGIRNLVFKVKNKTGSPSTVLFNVTAKISSNKKVIGALFVGHDITELTEYRRSLERKVEEHTQKLKEALTKEKELVEIRNRFVSIATHEFKIPLAYINTTVQALLNHRYPEEEDRDKLSGIAQQVAHMKVLLDDVLTVGKTAPQKIKPSYSKVNIPVFLQKIIAEVVLATHHTHTVVTDFCSPYLIIESDEKLLRNIFVNLLSNAIKFSPNKNEVQVKIYMRDGLVNISILDFGIGIKNSDKETLFEPFTRGTNVSDIHGTGLGLSIVKKAIDSLDGNLSLESKVNQGTKFTLQLKSYLEPIYHKQHGKSFAR